MGRPNLASLQHSPSRPNSTWCRIIVCTLLAAILLPSSLVSAQQIQAVPVDAAAEPNASARERHKEDAKTGDAEARDANGADAKTSHDKSDGDKPAEEKKEESDEEKSDSLKRPTAPPRVPDPREFDVRPDKNARIKFNFHGQPWPDVLQWLAIIGGYSLDWQELPNDYINVSSSKEYSLAEVLDLFNRLLFDRGYTMVLQGQVMSVVKIEKLDPSLLARRRRIATAGSAGA